MDDLLVKGVVLLSLFIMFALGYWTARDTNQRKFNASNEINSMVYGWALVGLFSVILRW